MNLPADTHVHSEWSWDTGGPTSAAAGTMARTCAQAERIGLSTLVFTEHLDFDRWRGDPEDFEPHQRSLIRDGHLYPPRLDLAGYLDSIDRCRHRHPELRILTGAEYAQPHLFDPVVGEVVDLGALDRVNGSLHTIPDGTDRAEPTTLYRSWPAERVVTAYLEEVLRMVPGSDSFAVFTHIDYPARYWPAAEIGPFDPRAFEEPLRAAMRAIAASGRALEINTGTLRAWIPRWWAEEGGRAVSFGSDAHEPEPLAQNFGEAMALVEAYGFGPGRRPEDFWTR